MSDPEGPPGKAVLPFDVEACRKLLDVRSDVELPNWGPEQDIPWSNIVRGEQRTVVGGSRFPFPRTGKISHHELKRGVNPGRHVIGWFRSEVTPRKGCGEL